MVRRVARRAGALFGITLATLMLAFPGLVAATTNEPIAQTGGMTATFPLLGTSLTVGVTLNDVGDISDVALDPTGSLTKTAGDTHMVKFSNADGTAKVSVRAGGSSLSIKAKSTLTSLSGDSSWAADVFGTGTKSTVKYTIGSNAGAPTLAFGAITTPGGVTSAVTAPVSKTGKDGKQAWTAGGVTFTSGGYVKHLWITVSANTTDGTAKVAITLSGRDKLKLTGTVAELAGARTWTAHLCDKTPVTVAYHVASDGSVVFDSATPTTFKEKAFDAAKFGHWKGAKAVDVKGFFLRFDKTFVGVAAFLKNNGDGTYTLVVKGSSGFCGLKNHPNGFGFGFGHGNGHGFGVGFAHDKGHGAQDAAFTKNDKHGGNGGRQHG